MGMSSSDSREETLVGSKEQRWRTRRGKTAQNSKPSPPRCSQRGVTYGRPAWLRTAPPVKGRMPRCKARIAWSAKAKGTKEHILAHNLGRISLLVPLLITPLPLLACTCTHTTESSMLLPSSPPPHTVALLASPLLSRLESRDARQQQQQHECTI